MKTVQQMTQAECGRLTATEAKQLILSVFPQAEVRFIENIHTMHKGYVIRNTCSRVWTGYQKTEDNAWKSAANSLWQLAKFYPKEMPKKV